MCFLWKQRFRPKFRRVNKSPSLFSISLYQNKNSIYIWFRCIYFYMRSWHMTMINHFVPFTFFTRVFKAKIYHIVCDCGWWHVIFVFITVIFGNFFGFLKEEFRIRYTYCQHANETSTCKRIIYNCSNFHTVNEIIKV